MAHKSKSAPVATFRGVSVRRKQYDAVAAAFDVFHSLQGSLVADIDGDVKALKREIAVREALKEAAKAING